MSESNLNIVYVCREFGPVTGGGIGTYIFNVCRSMVERGHQVFLLTDCFNIGNMEMLPRGVVLVSTVASPTLRHGNFVTPMHEYSYRVLDTLRILSGEKQVDIVEFAEFGVEGFATIRAKRLYNEFADTKLVVKLHTPSSLLHEINENMALAIETPLVCMMEDYCVQHADMVTSPSLSLGEYFENRVGRMDIRKCPYPIDLPVVNRSGSFSMEQVKRVRFVGSVQIRKGLDTFIEAAKIILSEQPSFVFEIWGADRNTPIFGKTYVDILKCAIPVEYSEKIVFKGVVPYREIPELFADSCYCVYPSRWENWANVCLEAMSAGCVVLASQNGGMAEMIEHGISGYVIDPFDPNDIASCILDSCLSEQLLNDISKAAQQRSVEICDPETTTFKIEENYKLPLIKREWCGFGEEPPLVSVIIPYYNHQQYIEETVESVKAAEYPNYEIVVVNDGSTSEEANQFFDRMQNVVKVSKANGGLSSARNAGIAAAKGEFILPLNSDDLLHADYLRLGVETLLNNPELSYVSCHSKNFGALDGTSIPIGFVPEMMLFMNTQGKCTNLYRRQVFNVCGGYDEIMNSYEDWDFLIKLYENDCEGDVLPDELFLCRCHFDSNRYKLTREYRTDLIQYMMSKYSNTFKDLAPTIAMLLARLWSETKAQYEYTSRQLGNQTLRPDNIDDLDMGAVTKFQVYSRKKGNYDENNSVYIHYPAKKWQTFRINLPFADQEGDYRLDPASSPGLIVIRDIVLQNKQTGEVIKRANVSNGFAGLSVQSNDQTFIDNGCLVITAKTDDPQVIFSSESARYVSVELFVTIYYAGGHVKLAEVPKPPGVKVEECKGFLGSLMDRFLGHHFSTRKKYKQ